jgi:GNAT superfamily N-acetyltransferase
MENIQISTDQNRLQLNRIHRYLSEESYWGQKIPKTIIVKAISNSLCFGVYIGETGAEIQVGFARVVTDKATFAYLCDVYIEKDHQAKGLGKLLIAEIMKHPELQDLRRFCLATKDAHSLYERFGFKITEFPERWMEIRDPEVYERLSRSL